MIVDGRAPGAEAPLDYDVLIVGGGPAGVTLAAELDGTGLRVALLESGGQDFDPDTQMLYEGPVTGLDEVDLVAVRLRLLGGTSHHWGGNCLPLDPIDFERAPFSGLTGWPFGAGELAPYYVRAHDVLDLGADEYGLDAAQGVGPRDLLLPGDGTVETVVLRHSANPPTNFAAKYGPMLEASDNVAAWLWTNVVGLDVTGEGRVEGVRTRTLSGEARRFTAREVVLACGSVENARLALWMNAENGTSFGDAGGLLGAAYMDHPTGGAAFLWPTEPLGPKAYWNRDLVSQDGTELSLLWRLNEAVMAREGLANAQFYLLPYSSDTAARTRDRDAKRGMRALKSMAKWGLGRDQPNFALSEAYCTFIQDADAMVAEAVLPETGTVDRVLLKYEAEQQPERASRVSLAEDRDAFGLPRAALHWSPTAFDRESVIRTTALFAQAVGASDLGRLEFEEGREERWWNFTTSWHQLGTARMSVAPSDGVTDPHGRLHGTQNLHVAGGATMPSAGRANPTLTIVALTLRLADRIKTRFA